MRTRELVNEWRRTRQRLRVEAAYRRARQNDLSTTDNAEAITSALRERTSHLDIQRLIAEAPSLEYSGNTATDVSLLGLLSFHLLNLDHDQFRSTAEQLLVNLEDRSREFQSDGFNLTRLNGWCAVVNNLAGFTHYANRYFLYRLGHVLDSPELSSRLEALVIAGFVELDRMFDRRIAGPSQWARVVHAEDAVGRARLANAVNYLQRDAYVFESSYPLGGLSELLAVDHYDILVRCATFPIVSYSRSDDRLYQSIIASVDSLEEYFTTTGPSSYLELMNRPFEKSKSAASLFGFLMTSCRALKRDDTVENVKRALMLEDEDLAAWRPSSLPVPISDEDEDEFVDDCPLAWVEAAFGGESAAAKLKRARLYMEYGDPEFAVGSLPDEPEVARMSLAVLHSYLALIGQLLSSSQLETCLGWVAPRLRRLSRSHVHDINFAARAIQFSEVVEDHRILENANAAFDAISRTVEMPETPDESRIVMFCLEQDRVTPALATALLPSLQEAGVVFRNLQQNRFENHVVQPWSRSPQLTADGAALVGSAVGPDTFHLEWKVDLNAGIVESGGVNYYQGLYERVARILKVYTIDWELPATRGWVSRMLLQLDRAVAALEGVREIAERDSLSVRFVTLQSQFTPFSAIRAYCASHPDHLEHVTVSSSYENWKSNVGGEPLSTLALLNNTRHPEPSIPAFGTRKQFENWVEEEFAERPEHFKSMNEELTGMHRAGAPTREASAILDQMRQDRLEGRKVFCLLGKIPYDLAVPYQGGPAHESMADWLNHTIDVVGGTEHRLYVKPHPHEENLSISARAIEPFTQLIRNPESKGLAILPHKGVNVQDLIGLVDLFLCWNGSSIAELGSQGAAVMACDSWAAKNYPIEVSLPMDRDHYERVLRGIDAPVMHADFQTLSTAYTCFLVEAPFAIGSPFINRSSTNTLFNRATLDFEKLSDGAIPALLGRTEEILEIFGVSDEQGGS